VGQKGVRVQAVIAELGNEKIDVIAYSDDSAKFVAAALSPAKVEKVRTDEEAKTAYVEVPGDQLSLAIGKEGQNVRLAAKLVGWKIDIKGAEGFQGAPQGKEEAQEQEASEKKSTKKKTDKATKTKTPKKAAKKSKTSERDEVAQPEE
jgi:N utilization substance protein A